MKAILPFLTLSTITASALVISHSSGKWPESFGKELEPLREKASTTEWATGSQEDSHQIPFETREEFEKYWPAISRLLKPGAKLTLQPPDKDANAMVLVIQAPPASVAFGEEERRTIHLGYQWPKSAYLPDGSLPEYLHYEGMGEDRKLVPVANLDTFRGFRYRARIDITLTCDGTIVDLNRIRFPAGVVIDDQRGG